MSNGFSTSLYITRIEMEKFPNPHDLRVSIFDAIKQKEDELNSAGFVLYEEDMNIGFYEPSVGRVLITYRTNFISKDKIILLSFYPKSSGDENSKDPKYWLKRNNLTIAKRVLEFSDILGDILEVPVEDYCSLKFERIFYREYINISSWNALLFEKARVPIKEVLKKRKIVYRQLYTDAKKNKYIFVLFSSIPFSKDIDHDTKKSGIKAINTLKQELQKFGKVDGPYNLLEFKYILEGYPKEAKLIAIFVESDEIISEVYKNFKKYLDIQNIPSQFVSINTINNKFTIPTIKLNFLLEIFSKIKDKKPLSLEPTPNISTIDGVLCLSDVKDASKINKQRLFGALFMYTLSHRYEEIHIYEDIKYKVRKGHINFEPEDISRLVNYVYYLGGPENLKIDIFLTMPWTKEDIQKFSEELSRKGYKINKIYYISTMRARSVDEVILNNQLLENNVEYKIPNVFRPKISEYWHFYKILCKSAAVIRTSTKLRIYPALFNIYVELMWPETASLSEEDIEKIIWFTKKRLYRFQEFFVTKTPEPIWIFRNLRKIYLGEVTGTIRVPLRLMI